MYSDDLFYLRYNSEGSGLPGIARLVIASIKTMERMPFRNFEDWRGPKTP
jgi:hypothetical protein